MYTPDNWIVFEFETPDGKKFRKVLGGWSGGYLDGDSWRLNSGIVDVKDDGDYLLFIGHSGSTYKCHKNSNTIRLNIAHIWDKIQKMQDSVKEIKLEQILKELEK